MIFQITQSDYNMLDRYSIKKNRLDGIQLNSIK